MAESRKILGQTALAATTSTAVYTVPDGTSAEVTVNFCNRGAATSFRLSIGVDGAALNDKQYLYYDRALAANDSYGVDLGVRLSQRDVVRAYAGSANVSVSVLGSEFS